MKPKRSSRRLSIWDCVSVSIGSLEARNLALWCGYSILGIFQPLVDDIGSSVAARKKDGTSERQISILLFLKCACLLTAHAVLLS